MSIQNIKQVLLNRISVIRLTEGSRTASPAELLLLKKKFQGLLAEEVVFTSIVPNPGVTNGYVAAIDVSKTRDYVMTNQRFVSGSLRGIAAPSATVVTTDEEIAAAAKPGLYISNESGTVFVLIDEGDDISKIFGHLGYTFEDTEYTYDPSTGKFTSKSQIVIGDAMVKNVVASKNELGTLSLTSESDTINVNHEMDVTVKLVDSSGNPLPNETITLQIKDGTGYVTPESVTTATDGTAVAKVASSVEGTISVDAFFGLYLRAETLTLTAAIIPTNYTLSDFKGSVSTVVAGGTVTVTGTVTDDDGSSMKGVAVALKSDLQPGLDTTVILDEDGAVSKDLVLTIAGTQSITAWINNKQVGGVTVAVTADTTSPAFLADSPAISKTTMTQGDAFTITATVVDGYGNPIPSPEVTMVDNGGTPKTISGNADGTVAFDLFADVVGENDFVITIGEASASFKATVAIDTSTAKPFDFMATVDGTTSVSQVTVGQTFKLVGKIVNQYSTPLANYPLSLVVGDAAAVNLTSDADGNVSINEILNDVADNVDLVVTVNKQNATVGVKVVADPTTVVNAVSFTDTSGKAITSTTAGVPIKVVAKLLTGAGNASADASATLKVAGMADVTAQSGSDGVVTFDLTLTTAAAGATVEVDCNSSTKTANIAVGADVASAQALASDITSDKATITAGQTNTTTVLVKDQYNNVLPGQTVVFTADGTANNVTTGDNGIASFAYVGKTAGNQTIAVAFGGSTIKTLTVRVTPDSSSAKVKDGSFVVDPTTVTAGSTAAVSATIVDQYGNAIPSFNITFTGGDSNVSVSTNSAGLAKSNLTFSTVGTDNVGISGTGITDNDTIAVTVNAAAAG